MIANPLLASLRAHYGAELDRHLLYRSLQAGEPLAIQNDPVSHFFLVTNGWAKVTRLTADGQEATIDLVATGQLIGADAAFLERPWPAWVWAATPLEVLGIETPILRAAAHDAVAVAEALADHLAAINEEHMRQIEHLTIQAAHQRVACFVLRHCPEGAMRGVRAPMPPTKALVAAAVGIKPETLSRALAQLQRDAGLRLDNGTACVPVLERLTAQCCATCSVGFPCHLRRQMTQMAAE